MATEVSGTPQSTNRDINFVNVLYSDHPPRDITYIRYYLSSHSCFVDNFLIDIAVFFEKRGNCLMICDMALAHCKFKL